MRGHPLPQLVRELPPTPITHPTQLNSQSYWLSISITRTLETFKSSTTKCFPSDVHYRSDDSSLTHRHMTHPAALID